ncbi:MAG: preprotein translocase subunit SecA [Eubacterium sp.]|nr:preprotein translocase subunit SecA [Eubacterium sp.]MDD7208612.1 preprotein translocase subunit SecA [Lachnospiraceae bacterium]MDY5497393.1 preprotein translocase subunit SecA [Anaerobutyricum sp.]
MGFVDKLFGNKSEKEIKRIIKYVDAIEALDEKMQALSDEELKAKTQEFKDRLAAGETLDDILVEAFAVVREAADRTIHLKPYRVQLIGGIILHQGRIAEMKTGEGKTLVSTLPAYLNALEGKGVHIVTVNDYLAKRDANWMGKVHQFLGLSVGVILNSYDTAERQAAYNCDITYITNNELGFDYLRDNMVIYKQDLVQRELNYAIVDEVDSVLIDEARTPLIISGQSGKSTDLYKACDVLARQMQRGSSDGELSKIDAIMGIDIEEDGDFLVNEKDKQVMLTQEGVKKVENFFHIKNLADPDNLEIQHNIILALRAHNLMFRDRDYVVKDNEVLIVDEFTGRIMPGRRYSDGLHQAIEAKEHVKVNRESKTLATITFQNFFNKYKKKAGMTGTAMTEDKEFMDIYGMDVVEIPTNKPMIRVDHEDSIFMTKKEKLNAVIDDIVRSHEKGQPVLVGTINIDTSEEVSQMLTKRGIKHNVLNAKFHELEAEIISHAGEKGAVTIATNMAGRGTDIKLGEGVAELGGLKIIGTERHESRRIDNQLRGRSGRQGDPGESKFYLSLEDDLMRLFGSERMMGVYKALKIPEGEEIQHKTITKQIEKAQKKIENNNFGIRRNLLDYDQVNNDQREVIYAERRRVLDGESMRDVVYKMIKDVVVDDVNMALGDQDLKNINLIELNESLRKKIPLEPITLTEEEIEKNQKEEFISRLQDEAMAIYHAREKEFNEFAKVNMPDEDVELGQEDAALFNDGIREVERVILLKVIDSKWMSHIDDMDQLRESIGLQSYAQKDPVVQYKFLGYEMFEEMTKNIRHDTVGALMHVQIEQKVEREQVARATGTNKDGVVGRSPYRRKEAKIGRNAPCPCGSGKKYKNCCGRFAN